MEAGIVFDLDPTIFRFGPFQLRYYGIIFVVMLYLGYFAWRSQILRGGYREEIAQNFLLWGVLGVVIGARLGHVLFYDPGYYLSNPLQILVLWRGGLASHGAAVALIAVLALYARHYRASILDIFDRFAFSAAIGAAMVRLGNFFNSEVVGRPTDLPWGVRFMRYDGGAVARHPSQLYEFLMGVAILVILVIVDRKSGREQRPVGLLSGAFLALYFLARFLVEFVKEFQALSDSALTMGQYLSIVPFLIGMGLVGHALKQGMPANNVTP
jgi:prolipoprotein diacylglyceryl transferase